MALVNTAKRDLLQAWIDDATTPTIMLLDSNHVTDIDAQVFIDDVNANEVSGTGYTAGGQALTNVAASVDDGNDQGILTFDNVVWDASGGTLAASAAVIFDDTGTPGTSKILAIEDFGSSKQADDANFTIKDDDVNGAVAIT